MNSNVEARIEAYLTDELHCKPHECSLVLDKLRSLARAAGFALDEAFGDVGLGAGPEARIASRLVGRALGQGGDEASDDEIRNQVTAWLRSTPGARR